MAIVFKVLLIAVGIILLLICAFVICTMATRSRTKDDYRRLQIDNALWGTAFLVLAGLCFWGSSRL